VNISDDESEYGSDPPTIARGISANGYSSNYGSKEHHFNRDEESDDGSDPPAIVCGISADEYGSEVVDDWLFFGSGQPITSIRPARLSEMSELTDDDVGELAVV
jgi:hypothetical protein